MPHSPVAFNDVEVIEKNMLGFRVRVGDKVVFVGALQPQPGTTIRIRGDKGRLVLRRQDAWNLGLTTPPTAA